MGYRTYDDVINSETKILSRVDNMEYYLGYRCVEPEKFNNYSVLIPRLFSSSAIDKLDDLVLCELGYNWGFEALNKRSVDSKLYFYTVIKRETLFNSPPVGAICCSKRSYRKLEDNLIFFNSMLGRAEYCISKKSILPLNGESLLRLYDVMFNRYQFGHSETVVRCLRFAIENKTKKENIDLIGAVQYGDKVILPVILFDVYIRIPKEFKPILKKINIEVGDFLKKNSSSRLSSLYSELIHYGDFRRDELDYILGKTDIVPDKHFSNYKPV